MNVYVCVWDTERKKERKKERKDVSVGMNTYAMLNFS